MAVGQQGPLDDPDGDGLENLLEYALDLSPNGPSTEPPGIISGGNLTYTYRRARSDVFYIVEASADLINWSPVGVIQGTPLPDGTTTASIPLSTGAQYLHLKVSR